MCVLVSLCPVVAGDPLEVDLLHCYLKVSRLLPTEDCDQMCVWRLCVHGRVCLVGIEYTSVWNMKQSFHLYVSDFE